MKRSVLDVWLHVVAHVARLAESVRREMSARIIADLAATVFWLFSFVSKCQNSLVPDDRVFRIALPPSSLIWNKYPGTCPACFDFWITEQILNLGAVPPSELTAVFQRERAAVLFQLESAAASNTVPRPCTCLSRIAITEQRHEHYRVLEDDLHDLRLHYARQSVVRQRGLTSVPDIEAMFSKLFENSYVLLSLEAVAFHLLEEVGEVTEALKACYTYERTQAPWSEQAARRRVLKLEEEIADVFSWAFAVVLKIKKSRFEEVEKYLNEFPDRVISGFEFTKRITLADIVWTKYGITADKQVSDRLLCPGCHKRPCGCKHDLRVAWAGSS